MNKSGEKKHLSLVPDVREKAFSFSPLRMKLAVGIFVVVLCQVEESAVYF